MTLRLIIVSSYHRIDEGVVADIDRVDIEVGQLSVHLMIIDGVVRVDAYPHGMDNRAVSTMWLLQNVNGLAVIP